MGSRAWFVRNFLRIKLHEPLKPKSSLEERMDILEQNYRTDVALLHKNMHRVLSTVARDEKRQLELMQHYEGREEEEEQDNEYVQILKQVGIDTPEKLEAAIVKIKGSGILGIDEKAYL